MVAWFGATRPFGALTQTFLQTENGPFNAHHYRYFPTHSTFLVETTAQNFTKLGLSKLAVEESRAFCENMFAETLEGAQLISNINRLGRVDPDRLASTSPLFVQQYAEWRAAQ